MQLFQRATTSSCCSYSRLCPYSYSSAPPPNASGYECSLSFCTFFLLLPLLLQPTLLLYRRHWWCSCCQASFLLLLTLTPPPLLWVTGLLLKREQVALPVGNGAAFHAASGDVVELKCLLVRRLRNYGRRFADAPCLRPPHGAQAPLIPRAQSCHRLYDRCCY